MMKKLFKALLAVLLVLVLAVGGLFGFLTATEYKPAPVESLAFFDVPENPAPILQPGQSLRLLTWNVGYAGLGAESDFFMDGGENSMAADRDTVVRYLSGIAAQIMLGDYDLVLLQEVDRDSKRSYGIDEAPFLSIGQAVHALNYSCPFVPIPVPPIGRVHSGLMTTSEYQMASAVRVALPCPFHWPLSTANLKRCLLVTRLPIQGSDRELVLVNLHLEAYDDGAGKLAQTEQLMGLLEEEYRKGNFVIAGGDFNQSFPGSLERYPIQNPEIWMPGLLEEDALPEGFSWVYDTAVPSCRLLNEPYDAHSTQHYVIDGFLVSPNVTVSAVETLDLGFENSDHNPVCMSIELA